MRRHLVCRPGAERGGLLSWDIHAKEVGSTMMSGIGNAPIFKWQQFHSAWQAGMDNFAFWRSRFVTIWSRPKVLDICTSIDRFGHCKDDGWTCWWLIYSTEELYHLRCTLLGLRCSVPVVNVVQYFDTGTIATLVDNAGGLHE